ncbi:carbohydrate kinase [Nocardioides sp. Arc9.136]|uniref:carbohydrate kinase family protein n=1 Tax=Nocardioides sp. Arc9.136 TaxID=2996826 RepID=UPI002664FFAA|nr:carbohydrate kinase [Nocardioides sp. Arc9.136]WKN47854.1 carbohydrate kinase [Nocardioides sp. Arc9.136]
MEPGAEQDVLVVGESLVDVVRAADGTTREHPGGSAANVAVALARLGRPVRFATAYAEDDHGAMLAEHLAGSGVRLATDPATISRTSTALATIGTDGAASYTFDLAWELGPVDPDPAPVVVHTCSLGAVLAPGAEDVVALLRRLRDRATVTYDVNARPAVTGTGPDVVARVERVAALADLVKASDEDLAALWPDLDEASAVSRLLDLGPAAVVVTRGGEGATWTGARSAVEVASLPVEVADTIGAGDTFGAALVDALWERGLLGADRRAALGAIGDEEVAAVLDHAARAAAVTVSRPGADPPYRHEL